MEQGSGLKFLADRNMSPVLVRILCSLGAGKIHSLHNKPEDQYRDEDWIPLYAELGYIIITPDRQQLREEVVARALVQSNARIVFLPRSFADSKRWDQALWLLKYWWKIRERAATMVDGELVSYHKFGTHSIVRPDFERRKRKTRARANKTRPPAAQPRLLDNQYPE